MEVARAHSSMDMLDMNQEGNGRRAALPARASHFVIRKLANVRGRFGVKLRRTRSMDINPKPMVSNLNLNQPTVAMDLDDFPRSISSESSPGTSQGKRSMDSRPYPNPHPQRTTQDSHLTPLPPVTHGRTSPSPVASPPRENIDSPRSSPNPVGSGEAAAQERLTQNLQDDGRSDSSPVFDSSKANASRAEAPEPAAPSQVPTVSDASNHLLAPTHLDGNRPRSKTTPLPFIAEPEPIDSADILSALAAIGRSSSSSTARPTILPQDYRTDIPPSLIAGPSSTRPSAPHLTSLPPFSSPRFSISGAPARLSPAIVTRQPRYPILTLPPISTIPATPTNSLTRPRSHSLRSMPALPMAGSENHDQADHQNAMLDDLEEEDDDGDIMIEEDDDHAMEEDGLDSGRTGQSDDDGESIASEHTSTMRPGAPARDGLPAVKTSPLDTSFLNSIKGRMTSPDDRTPRGFLGMDYFTSKQPETGGASHSPVVTPRAFSAAWAPLTRNIPPSPVVPNTVPLPWQPQPRMVPMPSTPPTLNARPSLYHQASRSMVDMTEMLHKKEQQQQQQQRTPEIAHKTPKGKSPLFPSATPAYVPNDILPSSSSENLLLGPSLKRQHSMPTFTEHTAPPPYPQFFGKGGPLIMPRDEEGCEGLPKYSNDIYLRAIMPRKMEFSAPGVQARDRKWRRTLCVLEGTAFRVYKCPPSAAGVGVIGNWWEKTVGVGDIAEPPQVVSAAAAQAKKDRERERESRRAKLDEGTPDPSAPQSPEPPAPASPTPSSSASGRSRLIPSNFRRGHRAGSLPETASPPSPTRSRFLSVDVSRGESSGTNNTSSGRRSFSSFRPNLAGGGSTPASPTPSARRSPRPPKRARPLWVEDPSVPPPDAKDLLHAYTLQNAESGLGSDYHKRRNVIRLRMEGEQFLLQAADIAAVVDWIEGFQAAANIALDLDERPMPKGPMFPRRRRRRARRPAGQTSEAAT